MKAEIIQFVGMDALNEEEKQVANALATEYYDKIKRGLNNFTSLMIHIKVYSKKADNKDKENHKHSRKYSIRVRVVAPTVSFDSTHAHDWDLARTFHTAFKEVESQIRHRFHSDVSAPDRPRVPQNMRHTKGSNLRE